MAFLSINDRAARNSLSRSTRRAAAVASTLFALSACSAPPTGSDVSALDAAQDERAPEDVAIDVSPPMDRPDVPPPMPDVAVDTPADQPVVVMGDNRVVQLSAGARHTCALQARGTVYCWGGNGNGQLGDGTSRTTRRVPTLVMGLDDATQIAAGSLFTCALRRNGTVLCWGSNNNGELGGGAMGPERLVPGPVAGVEEATRITAGSGHTCVIRRDETVLCWGWNRFSQVGDGTVDGFRRPTVVAGLGGVVQLDAGWSHTCARLRDGAVRCWGHNDSGQVGDGTRVGRPSVANVTGLRAALDFACGEKRSVALTAPDELWVWGRNETPSRLDDPMPAPTRFGSFTAISQLAPGSGFTCVRLESGRVQCWGRGALGSLGNGSNRDQLLPTDVAMLDDAVDVVAGDFHVCARRRSGSLACWGNNSDGQLGATTPASQSLVPVEVMPLP